MTVIPPVLRRGARRQRPRAAALAGVAAVVAVATACTGANASSKTSVSDPGAPRSGGTLKVSFFPDNPSLSCIDPFQVYWIESRSIIRNFADSLTDQDPATGKIVPWLATKWTISPDGLTYTFSLRSGPTFSNGKPVDAAAVAADANGWIQTVKQTNGAAYGASYIQGLTGATAVGPSTVTFTFSRPNSSFLQATSTTNLAITDPSEYQDAPQVRCTGKDVVGSGPFVLDHYTAKVETVLKKRTGYHWASSLEKNQGDAYLDSVVFNYVAEDSVRTGNLISGAIDVDWPRNPFTPQDEELIKRSGLAFQQRSLPGVSYAQFANTSSGHPLSDPNVRRALYKAIDLKTYAATIFGPSYPVVQGVFDSTTPYFVSEADKLGYDPAGAGQILQSDGWALGADGYRSKNGQQLALEYPVTQFTAGPELLQAQLKKVGINLKLRVLTPAQTATYLPQGAYDLTANYFTRADPGALQYILNPAVANSKALATRSAAPEVTAHLQELFASALQTTNAAQTRQAYTDLQSYLIDQGVVFPLFERVQEAGVGKSVHGFAFTSESFLKLNDVWKS